MKTIQGIEFNYDDIVLFHLSDSKVNILVNNEEQMAKYKETGNIKDLPVSIADNSASFEKKLLTKMKQIKAYKVVDNQVIVVYKDGTKMDFDITNLNDIKYVADAQKTQREINEKNKRRATMAGILAGTFIGTYFITDGISKLVDNKKSNDTPINSEFVVGGEYKKQALEMFERLEKTPFAKEVKWTPELAEGIIEYANGEYPLEMQTMDEEEALKKQEEIEYAIQTLISYNLSVTTDKIVNIADYVNSDKGRALINDALVMGRALSASDTSKKLISNSEWTTHAKLSSDKDEATENLMHYEYDTMYNSIYSELPASMRFIIASTYEMSNEYVPVWTHVTRERSEKDVREHELYFRYFINENNNYETFLPREIENNKVEYVLTYKDCSEKVYDEITMYVMAGRLINENHKYGDVEQVPGMKQFGVEIEVNNRVDEAMEQMRDNINIMSRANQYSKQK
mgnify:CR=1 FL=1